jgi:major membrane immunogen (membrane-anchored lipoprotein)
MFARTWTAKNRIELMKALVVALAAVAALTACTTAENSATRSGDGAYEGQRLNDIRNERRRRLLSTDER